MATIEQVEQLAQQILATVEGLHATLTIAASQIVVIGGLSDIDTNLGTVLAGEFQTGNLVPPGHGFSGMRMAYPAMTYNSEQWHLVGVNNDVMQFGVNASDGKLYAGAGSVVLSNTGVTLESQNANADMIDQNAIKFLRLDGTTVGASIYAYEFPATGFYGMRLSNKQGSLPYSHLNVQRQYYSTTYNETTISLQSTAAAHVAEVLVHADALTAWSSIELSSDQFLAQGTNAEFFFSGTCSFTGVSVDITQGLEVGTNLTVLGSFICDDFHTLDPDYAVAWTAATTNPTLGNGTLEAKYQRVGKLVTLSIHLVIGSTTTLGTGNYSFSLPIAASAAVGGQGVAHIRDSGTNNYERSVHIPPSATTLTFFQQLDNATNVNNISPTVPFAWATGDSLDVTVTYFVD